MWNKYVWEVLPMNQSAGMRYPYLHRRHPGRRVAAQQAGVDGGARDVPGLPRLLLRVLRGGHLHSRVRQGQEQRATVSGNIGYLDSWY